MSTTYDTTGLPRTFSPIKPGGRFWPSADIRVRATSIRAQPFRQEEIW
jgi:hypothetical protein